MDGPGEACKRRWRGKEASVRTNELIKTVTSVNAINRTAKDDRIGDRKSRT